MPAPLQKTLQGLQVSDKVVFFVIGQHFFIRGHSVSALVDLLADSGVSVLFAIIHLVATGNAFMSGSHVIFGSVGMVADGALLENFLAFFRITFSGKSRAGTHYQGQASCQERRSVHTSKVLL